jgi:hypothetical protein
MLRMRQAVAVNNVYRWAARFIMALSTLRVSAAGGTRSSDEKFTEVA